MQERSENVYNAKLAEVSERYDEMVEYMGKVCETGMELNEEERNLLSVAYKNVIGTRRASWRILNSFEGREGESEEKIEALKEYKKEIETEMQQFCLNAIDLIDKTLLENISVDSSNASESKVFYHKLRADYKRYLAEFQFGADRKPVAEECLVAYKLASELATSELTATHPIRIGVALNFSVFYYEIMDSRERACKLVKAAFEDAAAGLDDLPSERYKDTALMMQLLRSNLESWGKKKKKKKPSNLDVSASQTSMKKKGGEMDSVVSAAPSELGRF